MLLIVLFLSMFNLQIINADWNYHIIYIHQSYRKTRNMKWFNKNMNQRMSDRIASIFNIGLIIKNLILQNLSVSRLPFCGPDAQFIFSGDEWLPLCQKVGIFIWINHRLNPTKHTRTDLKTELFFNGPLHVFTGFQELFLTIKPDELILIH